MTVHANSLAAYQSLNLSERSANVLRVYVESVCPFTDREVMHRLGFTDPNAVRPRITELCDAGLLEEFDGGTLDPETGKRVRLCRPTAAAISRVRESDPVRSARKAICAHIAKMAEQGAAKADLARTFPAMTPAELDSHIKACWAYGCISNAANEWRNAEPVFHIAKLGLDTLKMPWPNHWHIDMPKPAAVGK
jgi:hypothetical protein